MANQAVSLDVESNGITKSDLIARLAAHYPQLVAKDADFAVKTILDAMTSSLSQGQRIEIRGFGSFGLNYRPPRVGRNPKSGDKVQVPEKHVPHFKAGKELRDRVDAGLNASGVSGAGGNSGGGGGVMVTTGSVRTGALRSAAGF